jgi:hypothetical protein
MLASCIWAIQAALAAAARHREYKDLLRALENLKDRIYLAIALRQEELRRFDNLAAVKQVRNSEFKR